MNSEQRSFVTLVSGLPRSGTSMMMQMLEAAGLPAVTDNIRRADDDNPKGYYEIEAAKRTKKDASWLNDSTGKVAKVIYMLLYDLPAEFEYRIVFMNRDLTEVLASQQTMLERRGESGANVSNDKLKTIFTSQLEKIREWLTDQPNFAVLHVDHHNVIEDAKNETMRINEFLGGGLDTDKMADAVNEKLYRQRTN